MRGRGAPPHQTRAAGGVALLCDADGRITEVVRDALGAGSAIAPGLNFAEVVDPACRPKAEKFLATLRERQAAFNWELNVAVGGGAVVPLHFAGGATRGGGFLVVGAGSRARVARFYEELVSVNNEQTNALRASVKELDRRGRERQERDEELYEELSRLNNELATAQRELAKKNAELSRLNEQKNQFLGIAAHDLRNPLQVIQVYSQFLLDEAALPPEQAEFVNKIDRSSAFMLELVDNLLDVSKIEAGKLGLDLARASLVAVVGQNVALNRALAERKGISVALEVEGDVPVMTLDVTKIEQVLNNLIGNAVKFSPPGSRVRVRLSREGGRAVIAVADEGPGIPADEAGKLFRPFQKGSVRSTGGERGAGLGLAIAHRIVAGHGGEIRVESEQGRGSTFYVSLPLGAPAAPASDQTERSREGR